jgi:hypothetical protein
MELLTVVVQAVSALFSILLCWVLFRELSRG